MYYNNGTRQLLKLAVSVYSLRKSYNGPAVIIANGDGINECEKIAKILSVDFKVAVRLKTEGKKFVYLNKCLYHLETPFETTIAIDNDMLILKDFTKMFEYAENNEFSVCQFSNWTTQSGIIHKRIKEWKTICPSLMDGAINYGHGINCGIISFTKESKLMMDWYNFAEKGRYISFIPDETCCQVILHQYPHFLADVSFNTSCKYGQVDTDTKIIHYHGRKHCRIENGIFVYHSDLWYKEMEEMFRRHPELAYLHDTDKHVMEFTAAYKEIQK
jgi:hypothetical protein